MDSTKSSPSVSAWIPQEILTEIFSRLPVKTLLRLRCVCKSWKSLISGPDFIRKHLVRMSSSGHPSHYHLLFNDIFTRLVDVSLDSVVGSKGFESISNPPMSVLRLNENSFRKLQPIGSCNGLILLLDCIGGTLLLWNPSIREIKILPDRALCKQVRLESVFNFGYDPLSNDYKVVGVFERQASLYSLRANSWRRITSSPHILRSSISCCGTSVCCGNVFIWKINSWKTFISFDLVKESFQEHPLPVYNRKRFYVLSELHGDLCAMYNLSSYIDVWVMKEFGIKESWVKIFTFPVLATSLCRPLCTWGDEFVLGGLSGVAIYNKKTGASKAIEFKGSQTWQAQIYVESLVSPNGE